MSNPAPGYLKNPDHHIHFEASPRRVRVKFGGEWIADSTDMVLMYEANHLPVYYFPVKDIRLDLLHPTDHSSHCPYKGDSSYWSIEAGGQTAENAVWAYQAPFDEMTAINLQDYCAFYWDRVDQWFEEDEEIFVHPRDPHKRIDTVPSSRSVKIMLGGETVAETTRAHFLFETGLPTRYYIPAEDIRADLLSPSDTQSRCPYKGIATYQTVTVGEQIFEDIVWSYPKPVPECPKIEGLQCFFNEQVDAIFVDGKEIDKPITKWTKEYR
ncbi:MAG: hypothetical protein ACI9JL_000588 [Paracoccaceae bacterium]|jgi:uncharacterized protein (DUF427 family)